MKSIITWVLLANAGSAKIVLNEGLGRGFVETTDGHWVAPPAIAHADAPTMTHSRVGEGQRRVERPSPEAKAQADFARLLCTHLIEERRKGRYDRLLLVAAPHMLGELRHHLTRELDAITIAQVPKDLVGSAMGELPSLLKDYVAA